jgi:hypothetical protein
MNRLFLLALVLAAGCGSIERQISGRQLAEMDEAGRSRSLINRNYYKGSDSAFHYFYVMEMIAEGNYRVEQAELRVTQLMPFTKDPTQWQMVYLVSDDDGVVALTEAQWKQIWSDLLPKYPATSPSTKPYDPNDLRL